MKVKKTVEYNHETGNFKITDPAFFHSLNADDEKLEIMSQSLIAATQRLTAMGQRLKTAASDLHCAAQRVQVAAQDLQQDQAAEAVRDAFILPRTGRTEQR